MTREESIKIIQQEYKCVDAECDIERNCGKCEYHMPSKEPILEAYKMAIQALEQQKVKEIQGIMEGGWTVTFEVPEIEPCDDAVSRQAVLEMAYDMSEIDGEHFTEPCMVVDVEDIQKLPSVTQKSGKWIPVSERLPEDLEPVNITWVNHNPERYYEEFKDKPFTATGHCCKGRWYWYSCTCQDYLEEYGRCDFDEIDTDIEVIAWMPLPEPFEPQESEVRNESKR